MAEWVEPEVDVRRLRIISDRRVGEGSGWHVEGKAESTGVPDSRVAQLMRSRVTFKDLTLEPELRGRLYRCIQHAQWRIGETRVGSGALKRNSDGYRLLLSGPPGVGKSMFAEVMASHLERPLVRLDLSSVLSRWLGETEQHIAELFDVAESAGAVLLMDEAESMLRQRDMDRGGGALATGVAYLLTRLEDYKGVLVATTNRIRDLDEAFFRRFDDHVAMRIPEVETRTILWKQMVGEGWENLDLGLIAQEYAIGGAMIRGATLRARAWADSEDEELNTPVVLAAIVRELEKHERSWSKRGLGPYGEEVMRWLEHKVSGEAFRPSSKAS